MRESLLQRKLIEDLRSVGCEVFNVHGHAMQASGWPDIQVYSPYWTGHLELKTSGTPRELQRMVVNRLRARGTAAFFVIGRGDDLLVEDCFTLEGYWQGERRSRVSMLLGSLREVSLPIWQKWWEFDETRWRDAYR